MKYLLISMISITLLNAPSVSAETLAVQAPFASSLESHIRHYNRASAALATSGTPENKAFAELSEKGIETFIDLRNKEDLVTAARTEVNHTGKTYHNIPVFSDEGIKPGQLKAFAETYENATGPILLFCRSGNRVGALWAAYRISKGIDPEQAIQEGRTAGMKPYLETHIRETYLSK